MNTTFANTTRWARQYVCYWWQESGFLGQVVSGLDIYRPAAVLVRRHDQDASIQAAMNADAMLDKGDLDGYAAWKRILRAVEELQGTEPKPGQAVH